MNFILSVFLFFCSYFQASSQEISNKLLLSYSRNELEQMNQNSPEKYQLLEFALEHGLTIEPYVESKHFELEKVSFKSQSLKPAFTDFGLKIKDKRQNFYWKDNDVVISIMSYGALKHLKTLER
jgi:hypothetical protein